MRHTSKKYRLIPVPERGLFRVVCVRDLPNIAEVGELGGLVSGEQNLSHEDGCWIRHGAEVTEDARVSGNAIVAGEAKVFGSASISGYARVFDSAHVYGSASVRCHPPPGVRRFEDYIPVMIYGEAKVYDFAEILDSSVVHERARVYGAAVLAGGSVARGAANVRGKVHLLRGTHVSGDIFVTGAGFLECGEHIEAPAAWSRGDRVDVWADWMDGPPAILLANRKKLYYQPGQHLLRTGGSVALRTEVLPGSGARKRDMSIVDPYRGVQVSKNGSAVGK